MKKLIGIILLQLLVFPVMSQVYNYIPLTNYNIETNPSILTHSGMNNRLMVIQQNSIHPHRSFSYSSVRFSKRSNNEIWGLGLVLSSTRMTTEKKYRHGGLALGYRTIIGNFAYLKFGATYKVIDTDHSNTSFDYYTYKDDLNPQRKNLNDKVNLAVALTGESEQFYVVLSSLNLDLPWNKTVGSRQFPRYYVLNAGNLMGVVGQHQAREISYTGMIRQQPGAKNWVTSHYINLKHTLRLTRKLSCIQAARIGYLDQVHVHLVPFISFYGEQWAFSAQYNFHLDKKDFKISETSTIQISINTKL